MTFKKYVVSNISVEWDGHRVSFHERTENAQIPSHLVNKLNSIFGTSECEELFEQHFGETPVILYGEGYGYKIQNGGLYIQDDVSFILFDVLISGNYQPRSDVNSIAKVFGIDSVPVIFRGTIEEGIKYVQQKPMSTIGKSPMEDC